MIRRTLPRWGRGSEGAAVLAVGEPAETPLLTFLLFSPFLPYSFFMRFLLTFPLIMYNPPFSGRHLSAAERGGVNYIAQAFAGSTRPGRRVISLSGYHIRPIAFPMAEQGGTEVRKRSHPKGSSNPGAGARR